jgi:FtsH-binding integral membrane protein
MFWVNRIMYLVITGFACLLFSAYLLYDIQVGLKGFVICVGFMGCRVVGFDL